MSTTLETKSVAKAFGVTGRTAPKYGDNGLQYVSFLLSFRKESLDETFGELTAWHLDNTIYAINWYVTSGRASIELERHLDGLSPYRALDLLVKAISGAATGSVRDRVEAIKAIVATLEPKNTSTRN